MKKAMMIGMAAVLAAGTASAQSDVVMVNQGGSEASETQVTLEAALVSSHVWRGQVQNNDFVFQPQITASQYGVSINVWANMDLGESFNGTQGDISEIDLSLAYTLPLNINQVAFDVGLVNYHFAGNSDPAVATPSTTELFLRGTILSWKDYVVPVIPSVTFFGDVDQVEGTYILFDVAFPYEISEYLSVEGGFSAGYGNTSYNDYYWGAPLDAGWNDYNFYAGASYEIMEGLTAAVNLQYSMVEGAIADEAAAAYEDDQKFFGGVNIAYDF
ncbi:MAG: hypothetical protein ABFR47_03640 [Verrucomicrobiota bacterium]